MSDLISRDATLDCFCDWIDRYGHEHTADEDATYQRIAELPAVQPDHIADISKKADGDCISRQAVVKFFNDWISCLDENCHHQSVADMIIIKNDFKNLPSVQPESKWIPVSERLPDEGQKCLVSDKGAIGIDTYIGHGNPYNWKWYVKDYEAWMPLPEPYRGGDKE